MLITLPVSVGEALDKLTILDIKLAFVKDENRRSHIQQEFNLLENQLDEIKQKFSLFYRLLKHINLEIWEEMDDLRNNIETLKDEEYLRICKKTILDNDIRFRIKNKINFLADSSLKEQKGYDPTRIWLVFKDANPNYVNQVILYFSIRYDETYVVTSNQEGYFHTQDPTIIFCSKVEMKSEKDKVLTEKDFPIFSEKDLQLYSTSF